MAISFTARPCANPRCTATVPAGAARRRIYCSDPCKQTVAAKAREARLLSETAAVRVNVADREMRDLFGLVEGEDLLAEITETDIRDGIVRVIVVTAVGQIACLPDEVRSLALTDPPSLAEELIWSALDQQAEIEQARTHEAA